MAKRKPKPLKVVYKSVWSEKMTENEKKEAQRRLDDAYGFVFRKALENLKDKEDL
jgi:hypothetical protein